MAHRGLQQTFFGAKIVADRSRGRACVCGNFRHSNRLVAAFVHGLNCGGNHCLIADITYTFLCHGANVVQGGGLFNI